MLFASSANQSPEVSYVNSKVLVEYSQSVRSRYIEQLMVLPWEEVTKNRGASFDSLRNIFLHTIDAEDRLVNYVVAGRTKDWVSRSPEEFRDMDSIKKRASEIESKTKAYLAKLTPEELERKVDFSRPGMPPMIVRVEDILIHASLENIHHFGELIAMLWQMDVEPPHMGWLGYLQKK
jgi:uncharacterized damage-inducible protein DinB